MLQQFSWGHFLIASIVFSLIWYGFVGLVFFKKELWGVFGVGGLVTGSGNSGSAVVEVRSGAGLDDANSFFESGDEPLIGASKLPQGVSVLSSSQMSFAGPDAGDRYEQVGLVADVVQELKLIFVELSSSGGGKREFFKLVAGIAGSYGRIGGHPSIGLINDFIRLNAPFELSDGELAGLW